MSSLRDVRDEDLDVLYEQRTDPKAMWMAATPDDPRDRASFDELWARLRTESKHFTTRTIEHDGTVAGMIMSWPHFGQREIQIWIGREHWNKGIATRALTEFLEIETARPLYALAAKDNTGAIRVLEKFDFHVVQTGRNFDNVRGEPVEELLFAVD